MQNVRDPRGSKSSTQEEFNKDEYLNAVIDHNVELWGPYAKRIIAFYMGNHELMQIKHYGMDVTRQVVKELNLKYGTNILLGDLAGYLKLRFTVGGRHYMKNIWYQHIPNSGGKRSKGMLSVDIVKGQRPSADICISEHIHDTWIKPERVEVLLPSGKIKKERRWFLQMPTLKDEHQGRRRGYVNLKNYGDSPVGVLVLRFYADRRTLRIKTPEYEFVDDHKKLK